MTRERDDRSLKEKAREQITRVLDAWPAHRASDTWRDEMTRGMTAAADDPTDIARAVTKLIREHEDRYPPQVAVFVQTVARQRQARIREANDAERERQRRQAPQRQEPWRGWLALAANRAHITDRGIPGPATSPTLAPYLDLVNDLGYRNHHGCDEYRDADGHLHPADPDHDPRLHATALAGAERIWREQGMPDAPSITPPAKGMAA